MKLKEKDIREIAKLVDEGWGNGKIAAHYSVNVSNIKSLIRRYKLHGIDGILHGKSKSFTSDEKLVVINRYYVGESMSSLAIELNVNCGAVYSWIKKYEKLGYNGLKDNRGRPGRTKMGRPKKNITPTENTTSEKQVPLTDNERTELNELRKKTYQQQLEIDCLKKIQALVQERQNRQIKKKQ